MTNHDKTQGKFITLEGIEGAGKSTAVACVRDYLTQKGIPFITAREPGGTAFAELIREQVLKAKTTEILSPVSELLLMFAARVQNLQENILPALKKGQWVVCDRFTDASYAYQGGGRQLPTEWIATLEHFMGYVTPDLTILLDVSFTVSQARLKVRNAQADRIEQENEAFFDRVRQAYLARAKAEPHRFVIIDASAPLEAVSNKIHAALDQFSEGISHGD